MVAVVSAPTIDDARAAGRALTGAGAREVLAFGSVARGDAAPYSDIDLVVVLNDLDYRHRRSIAVEFKAVATEAAGRRVDVWLTDVPEWAAQNRRVASFAAAIRADLVAVAAGNGDDNAIRWDKEQVMAASDTEAAFRRLREAHRQINRLAEFHRPGAREQQAAAVGDEETYHELQADRLVQACTAAAMAIETAFKALGTDAQIDPQLLYRNHHVAPIVEQLAAEDRAAADVILTGAVTADSVVAWRTLGDYFPDPDEPQPEDLATVAYTTAIASAAAASAGYVNDKLARLHGRRAVNDSIDQALTELRAIARGVDITTGEPLPPDPGDDPTRGF